MANIPFPGGDRLADDVAGTTAPADETAATPIPSAQDTSGLSPELKQRMDDRVARAGGDLAAVDREIAAEIADLDNRYGATTEGFEQTQYQAARALLVAERSYLEMLSNRQ